MQLYFIRHAQSENNVLMDKTGSYDGRSSDPELTDLGHQQARLLAEFLSRKQSDIQIDPWHPQNVQTVSLTHLYTSLMVRAVATGIEISKATGLPLVGRLDLHKSGGIYLKNPETGVKEGLPGHTRAYFEKSFPELILPCSVDEQGWWNRPHEGDQEGLSRARCVVQEIYARHGETDDRVGLISHGDFFQLFLSIVFGHHLGNSPFFLLNNATISRIDLEANRIRVLYINRMDYLPGKLIS